jgi:hypothetical protein
MKRRWQRTATVAAAALLAAYFGARIAAPERSGLALAAGGGTGDGESGLVAVTTGAPGNNSNRLLLVNTNTKRIMVYRITGTYMRLIAARAYERDLQVAPTADARGLGFSFDDVKTAVDKVKLANPRALKAVRGREMVLTTQGGDKNGKADSAGNRIILINRTMKTILVYRLHGKSIWLIAARPFDADEMLLATPPARLIRGDGLSYEQVRKMIEDAEKAAKAGPRDRRVF